MEPKDCHHILAMEYYSGYRLWHPLQDLFQSNSRQKPATVLDDGRKGRPKYVELIKNIKKITSRWHLYDQYY